MGNGVTITYDGLGRRTDLRDPDLGWVHYDVDPLGRGVNPAFIAAQMGHATAKTTFYKYARWINGADAGSARSRLTAALSGIAQQSHGPIAAQE